jgi:hypothetical protein
MDCAMQTFVILIKPHPVWLLLKAGSPAQEVSSELLF